MRAKWFLGLVASLAGPLAGTTRVEAGDTFVQFNQLTQRLTQPVPWSIKPVSSVAQAGRPVVRVSVISPAILSSLPVMAAPSKVLPRASMAPAPAAMTAPPAIESEPSRVL